MFERHLTDEVLMLLVGGQLAEVSRWPATDHLQHCLACQRRYEETRSVHASWVAVSEYGLTNILRAESLLKHKHAKPEFRFPWAPVSAVFVCSLIVIFVLSFPKVVPEASASELLGHAIQHEGSVDAARTFQISVQGTMCGIGRGEGELIPVQSSNTCTQATSLIQRTPWRSHALSARTFHDWHDSLSERHDTVTRQSSSWTIDTVTPVGTVREASLVLQMADYHAFSLQLRFDNQQQITISEETHPSFFTNRADIKGNGPVKVVDNPADVLEVNAWDVLRRLNADSGWEANVLRDGNKVVVKASVQDEARKHEIEDAFRSYPDVDVDVHDYRESSSVQEFLAQRTLDGDAPALAVDWLKQQFPDSESRNRYANGTVELSKAVLGRSFVLTQLQKRRRDLRTCSCAAELSKLIDQETMLLIVAQKELSSAAQSLVGEGKRASSKPLSYEEAQRLDAALGYLLVAASTQNSVSYDENVETVRRLL